jgi:superfamily I DNA and/or RNA helicase
MPEDKNAKTVDIDTSGPEVDVELEDTSKPEPEVIETVEQEAAPKAEKPSDEKVATEPQAASPSQQDASDEKTETKKDELEDYSKDVQRRIAKLTKKWREAERQREDALRYAEAVKIEKEATLKKYSALEGASVKDREARIAAGLLAARAKLSDARNNQDLNAEIDAQRDIARLG